MKAIIKLCLLSVCTFVYFFISEMVYAQEKMTLNVETNGISLACVSENNVEFDVGDVATYKWLSSEDLSKQTPLNDFPIQNAKNGITTAQTLTPVNITPGSQYLVLCEVTFLNTTTKEQQVFTSKTYKVSQLKNGLFTFKIPHNHFANKTEPHYFYTPMYTTDYYNANEGYFRIKSDTGYHGTSFFTANLGGEMKYLDIKETEKFNKTENKYEDLVVYKNIPLGGGLRPLSHRRPDYLIDQNNLIYKSDESGAIKPLNLPPLKPETILFDGTNFSFSDYNGNFYKSLLPYAFADKDYPTSYYPDLAFHKLPIQDVTFHNLYPDYFGFYGSETRWGFYVRNHTFLLPTNSFPYLFEDGRSPKIVDVSRACGYSVAKGFIPWGYDDQSALNYILSQCQIYFLSHDGSLYFTGAEVEDAGIKFTTDELKNNLDKDKKRKPILKKIQMPLDSKGKEIRVKKMYLGSNFGALADNQPIFGVDVYHYFTSKYVLSTDGDIYFWGRVAKKVRGENKPAINSLVSTPEKINMPAKVKNFVMVKDKVVNEPWELKDTYIAELENNSLYGWGSNFYCNLGQEKIIPESRFPVKILDNYRNLVHKSNYFLAETPHGIVIWGNKICGPKLLPNDFKLQDNKFGFSFVDPSITSKLIYVGNEGVLKFVNLNDGFESGVIQGFKDISEISESHGYFLVLHNDNTMSYFNTKKFDYSKLVENPNILNNPSPQIDLQPLD